MQNLSGYLQFTDAQRARYEALYEGYRQFYTDPGNAVPKIIIHVPNERFPRWEEQLADPLVMLQAQLDVIRLHQEIGDDFVPAVRVNFGTAQVAAAFGCELTFPENNLPAAGTHVLASAEQVYQLARPTLESGWLPRLRQWTELWRENLPPGVMIQHPDIQSPFNTAHLVRGNDILMDFYDHPDAVNALLERVTDFMIELVDAVKAWGGADDGWFADWGALWKGRARISNCTSDLIGPELYLRFVLPHDLRLLRTIGGGRMHCCASSTRVIETFLRHAEITGLDCDAGLHDPWHLARVAPADVPLVFEHYGHPFPQTQRLLNGDWPSKRNIVVVTQAADVGQARQLLERLRRSVPD